MLNRRPRLFNDRRPRDRKFASIKGAAAMRNEDGNVEVTTFTGPVADHASNGPIAPVEDRRFHDCPSGDVADIPPPA